MAKTIKVTEFAQTDEQSFTAAGTCDKKSFVAKTIVYRGEPIFKVQEDQDGESKHLRMNDSQFNRGERIAIARYLKQVRFGKAAVESAATPPADELSELSVKELRGRCKEAGVSGYHRKGVVKADLVQMLQASA